MMLERRDSRDASLMARHGFDFIIDPGWVGIEPCVYVLASGPRETAARAAKLTRGGLI